MGPRLAHVVRISYDVTVGGWRGRGVTQKTDRFEFFCRSFRRTGVQALIGPFAPDVEQWASETVQLTVPGSWNVPCFSERGRRPHVGEAQEGSDLAD